MRVGLSSLAVGWFVLLSSDHYSGFHLSKHIQIDAIAMIGIST